MTHNDFLSFEEFNRRSATPPTHTTPAALGIAFVAGIYTLLRFLDFLGYPVWFWIRRSLHTMALDIARAVSPSPSLDSAASDDSAQSGGLMGNLFGMGASALSKGVRGVASALSRGSSDVPPGLGNFDNSCYQNSVIQGLASLPSLRRYLELTTADHPDLASDSTTTAALLHMIAQLNDPAKRGQNFWVRGKLKSMSTFTQQDAQEYYSRILDELDKELPKDIKDKASNDKASNDSSSNDSTSKDSDHSENTANRDSDKVSNNSHPPIPLEGSLAQRVGCTTCGYSEGLSLIPFNCITVSLGRRNAYDIRQLLDDHTDLEYIDGVECSKCTLLKLKRTLVPVVEKQGPDTPFAARLRLVQDALDDEDLKDSTLIKTLNIPKKNWVKSEKSKQVAIARAPKSLVLHVNRSIFDETTFAQYKNNAGVSYPSTLDLGAWCLGAAPSGTQKPDLDPKTDEWPRDPKKSMLAREHDDTPSPFQYRLRAAVTHFGTHGNGHYVCYRPHARPRKTEKDVEESDVADADADDAEADVEQLDAEDAEQQEEAQQKEEHEDIPQKNSQQETEEQAEEQNQKEQREGQNQKEQLEEQLETEDEQQQPPEQWYRFSDDTVYPVSEQEAHQGNVFMLFYELITDSKPEPLPLPLPTPQSQSQPLAPAQPATSDPSPLTTTAQPTPSTEPDNDHDTSETDPDSDTPAAQPAAIHATSTLSPRTMRTAGNKASRNSGSRASLPLVSAS